MVTSTRMVKTGKTSSNYDKMIQKNIKVLIKMGYTEAKAAEQAEMMCSMYKHTFAEMKEV